MFEIGIHSNTYHGYSLESAAKGAAAAGFRLMELSAVKGWTEHVASDMSDKEIAQVKELLGDYRIAAQSLSGHANILSPDGLTLLKRHAALAKRLGCSWLVTSVGEAHDDNETIVDEKPLQLALAQLLAECRSHGIGLSLEVHGKSYGTGAALENLITFSPQPDLGICYDTANCIFYGNIEAQDELTRLNRVTSVHLKEKAGQNNEWNFPALGAGKVNFPAIFAAFNAKGLVGPMNIEIEFTPDGPGSEEAVNAAVKQSRAYLDATLPGGFGPK